MFIDRRKIKEMIESLELASDRVGSSESSADDAARYASDANEYLESVANGLEEIIDALNGQNRREDLESELTQVILDAVPKVQEDVRSLIRDEISVLQDKVSQHINLALHQILDQVKEKLEEGGDE